MSPLGRKVPFRRPKPYGSETTAPKKIGAGIFASPLCTSSSIGRSSGRFRLSRNRRCSHTYLDLLRLRFLDLGDVQC